MVGGTESREKGRGGKRKNKGNNLNENERLEYNINTERDLGRNESKGAHGKLGREDKQDEKEPIFKKKKSGIKKKNTPSEKRFFVVAGWGRGKGEFKNKGNSGEGGMFIKRGRGGRVSVERNTIGRGL